MKIRTYCSALLMMFSTLALTSCSKDSNTTAPGTGTMRVRMTDAPGVYQAVNLVIREVAVRREGSDSTSGWQVLQPDSASYDLLLLRNGVFTTIGSSLLPAGHYTQIRLKLSPGSTIVVDGVTYPLTVPSGLQSGLKIVGDFDVPSGGLMDVALDFDVSRSIIQTGNGTYKLKPVVKAMPFTLAGAISGTVLPAGIATAVYAIQAPDTLGSTIVATDGSFKVSVLSAGVYSLAFDAAAGYRDTTLSGVAVTAGNTTSVGTVQLAVQ